MGYIIAIAQVLGGQGFVAVSKRVISTPCTANFPAEVSDIHTSLLTGSLQ